MIEFLKKFEYIYRPLRWVYLFFYRFNELYDVFMSSRYLFVNMMKSYIQRFFWIVKDLSINVSWIDFTIPNEPRLFIVFDEIFFRDAYARLSWLEHVLDLWWFVGDSAVYFSMRNSNVTVYEADPENYRYLRKNIIWNNVTAYNIAVVSDPNTDSIQLTKKEKYAIGASVSVSEKGFYSYDVPADFIWNILDENYYDWLKMDIEWSEYWIMEYLISNEKFNFKVWYIEFHLFENVEERVAIIRKIFSFLKDNWYSYLLNNGFNVESISEEDLFELILTWELKLFILSFTLWSFDENSN